MTTTPIVDRLEELVHERDRARDTAVLLEQQNAHLIEFLHDLAEHVEWIDRTEIAAGIDRLLKEIA